MSAVAASAAVAVPAPRPSVDGLIDAAAELLPRRRRLRSVPTAAGPVAPLELGNPLQLSKSMRARLLAAVRALLADPSLAGVPDVARLASVVLFAKSRAPQGRPDDNQTSTWGAELGRWLGVKESSVHHDVLPVLRKSGAVRTRVVTDAKGHPTALDCLVMPLWRARHAGGLGHALALTRSELAVLLRLLEVLFGPGWAPKGRAPTPAGLLAGRRGRGAATDRLGLLLMTLSTNSRGWLQLCPGSVDTSRGRPAATVARLLGCSPAGGAKVLKRLEAQGVAGVVRQETGSGLKGKSRVRLVAVAEAHGRTVREARKAAASVFSDLAATASGDHETAGIAGARVVTGVSGAGEGESACSADLAVGAQLHASHASVASSGGSLSLSGGFSGEGRGWNGGRPGRAGAREDQAREPAATGQLLLDRSDGDPLRGEEREKSPSISNEGNRGPVAAISVRGGDAAGQNRQQQERVPLPPEDLRVILAPVRAVWERLERQGARKLVEAATRTELRLVEGFAGRADAPQVLTERLARRLDEQMRLGAPIINPVGWLVSRALPQRQQCGDKLCDDRILLDSGRDCPRCEDRQASRSAQRHAVAAAVEGAMPYASEAERRAAADRQLHETVTAQAWARERRWEQVRVRQAEAAKHRAETAAAQASANKPAAPATPVVLSAPRPLPAAPAPQPEADVVDQELVLEDLTREQVLDWRTRADKDHDIVFAHIDRYGEHSAQRLFTRAFVADVQRLSRLGHLNLGYTTWERS
ncbi:hypothetical protein [Streptomyces sp. V4I2]|uniref:hypothetical protein n=1 Tax=Streptomyces sp. V4I2 TaxID=3042280 RepID=UPI0027D92BD5|nr:hypothetical protein [Streptomyces sp. V4I2]